MAVHFNEGEVKKRPGLFQRQTNSGLSPVAGAQDGICAIPIRAIWGPLGKVVKNVHLTDLNKNYGGGDYSTANTVAAAAEMFSGGSATVYTYRMGSGGKQASKTIDGLTITAKYPGTMEIRVAVKEKLGDTTRKQLLVYVGTTQVESFNFEADGEKEGANLISAVKNSNYVTITGEAAVVAPLAVASGVLEGGENPTVTNEDYSKAFAALETYFYNVIALDVDDDSDMSLSLLLQAYLDSAHKMGKNAFAVVGEKTDVDFSVRLGHARMFNDPLIIYLGGGWKAGSVNKDGVMGICHTAGVIASTPANQGITHKVINGATELCESLTYTQYEEAIDAGALMVSMSTDGSIWYDTGINTLVDPDEATQDNGWKKIRRTKVRLEMFDRLDRTLDPKVGRVSADSDGVSDIIQAGQRVLDTMAESEGKLFPGPVFAEDPSNPYDGDSAWFVIQADDIDSLEHIYLHYQFRYSQNV